MARLMTNWFWDEHGQWQRLCISLSQYFYDRRPYPVYFNTLSLIIYLNGIKTLICHTNIEVNRVNFWFCTKYNKWFSKYRIELTVGLSSANATKHGWMHLLKVSTKVCSFLAQYFSKRPLTLYQMTKVLPWPNWKHLLATNLILQKR